MLRGETRTNKPYFSFKPFSVFPFVSLRPSTHLRFLPAAECSRNGAHHELLLASPGRQIDIIKKPIKLRAGAFITVICEGLGLMGCLFPCAGLTAALVYCWNDANFPTQTHTHTHIYTSPVPAYQRCIKSCTQPNASRTRDGMDRNVE